MGTNTLRIWLLVFLFAGLTGASLAENAILNPSFEVGTYGWTWDTATDRRAPDGNSTVTVDRETAARGPACATSLP